MANDEQVKTVRIVIDASKAKDGAGEVEKALKSIDDKIEALGNSVGNAFNGLKNALLGFVSLDAIITQVKGLTEAFDRLGSRAATLGTSTEWLQAFEYAMASASVKIDEGYKALDKFTRLVGEGAQGNKAAVETLDRLGLKIFDVNKQVRPVSDLFGEAAAKIAGMTAGAEKNTLAVQAMGKTATLVVPALEAVGRGSDAMIKAGEKAGAIVSRESVAIWEGLASAADKSMIKWRAFAGENFAESVKKGFDLITGAIGGSLKLLQGFIEAMRALEASSQQFANIRNESDSAGLRRNVLAPINSAADLALENWKKQYRLLETAQGDVDRNPTGAAQARLEAQKRENITAAEVYNSLIRDQGVAAWKVANAAVGAPGTLPPVTRASFGLAPLPDPNAPKSGTTGAYGATATDNGAQADRQNKRIEALRAEAAATKLMANAALEGAAAVNEQEAEFKALQQALDVYGDKAKATDANVQALKKTFKELNAEIASNRGTIAFRLQTEDLGRQNEVLQKRLELYGQAPEIVAREIGLLQARNEVAKSGVKVSEEDIAARADAIGKQELLNQRLQETQRQQDLWLQPLKSALSSMQQGLAGFFEQLFSGGINSWQQFTDTMKKIFIRMLAELAAVSVIRPIIAPIIAGGQGTGMISPGVASQLGYPSLGSTPGNAGNGFSMPGGGLGGGGFGGMFGGSSFGQWLNTPFTGPYAGISPSAMEGVPMLSGAAGAGLTPLSALAGIGSIGMGAYGLMTSNSLGGKLGGAAGIIGGGLSLAASAGLIGSAFGPIGMGIGLLGGMLLPGLLGGEEKKPPKLMATGGLNFNAGKWSYNGSEYNGGKGLGGTLGGVGSTMQSLMDAAGVSSLTSSNSLNYQTMSQGEFSNATTFLNGKQWGQGSDGDAGLDTAAAHLAHMIMMEVGSGISDLMRQGLGNYGQQNLDHAFSTQELGTAVAELKALDATLKDLGKTITPAESALKAIDEQFKALTESAKKYGLDTGDITFQADKARSKVYTDFRDDLARQIDDMIVPVKGQLADIEKARKAANDNNAYLLANVKGAVDQGGDIDFLYGKQSAAVGTAFARSLDDQIDPSKGALADLDKWREQAIANNKAIVEANIGALNKILEIEQIYGDKRAEIVRQADEAALKKAVDAWQTVPELARGQFLFGKRGELASQLQAMNENTAALSASPMASQVNGWQREMGAFLKPVGDVFGLGSQEYQDATAASLKNYAAKMKAANDNFRDTMDGLAASDPFAVTIKGILKARDAAMEAAKALDSSGALMAEAARAYAKPLEQLGDEMNKSIRDQRLQLDDPLAFQIQQIRDQRDADLLKANQINSALAQVNESTMAEITARATRIDANGGVIVEVTNEADKAMLKAMTSHYVRAQDITELALRKELKLKEDFLAQSLASVDAYIKRLRYGDLSGVSPSERLAGVSGTYDAAVAQLSAKPYDQAALQNFSAAGADLAGELRSFYGSSPEFQRKRDELLQTAQAVENGVRLGVTTGAGGAVDPNVMALMQTVQALTAQLAASDGARAEGDQAVADLAAQVRRLVTGRQAA